MTPIAFLLNLNSEIRAKLTPAGVDYYKTWAVIQRERLKLTVDEVPIEVDEHGYFTGPIWHFAHVFGPQLRLGAPHLVEMNVEIQPI